MVDQERVCCLCGDVGFSQKLFRCSRCRFRFQHSYCSNYYGGDESSPSPSPPSTLCDWCQSQDISNSSSSSSSSSSSIGRLAGTGAAKIWQKDHIIRSEYASGERIKLHHHDDDQKLDQNLKQSTTNKNNTSSNSPRPNGHRRYKLLKDVMC